MVSPTLVENVVFKDQEVMESDPSKAKSMRLENSVWESSSFLERQRKLLRLKKLLMELQRKLLKLLNLEKRNENEVNELNHENKSTNFYLPTRTVGTNSLQEIDRNASHNNRLLGTNQNDSSFGRQSIVGKEFIH